MATFRLLTPEEHYPYKKLKITWFYGIDAIELADGNFVFPDRVIDDIDQSLIDQITEWEVDDNKIKIKYLDEDEEEQEIEIELPDDLEEFPTVDDPEFIEYGMI